MLVGLFVIVPVMKSEVRDIFVVVKKVFDLKVGVTFAIDVCMALLWLNRIFLEFVNLINSEEHWLVILTMSMLTRAHMSSHIV